MLGLYLKHTKIKTIQFSKQDPRKHDWVRFADFIGQEAIGQRTPYHAQFSQVFAKTA
jgi:hypothetical protein